MPRRPLPTTGPSLDDDALLDVRMADLPLAIEGTLAARIAQLRDELAPARPAASRCTSTCPTSGSRRTARTAIAIPFYLAHPRLEKLEEAQMFEVEGGEHEWCMRILRHEAGHAIDNAFRLRLRRQRREVFGSPVEALPGVLHAEAVQQELRAAPRRLVRAEPPRRGLRRDVRRLADAEQRVAAALRRLAGAAEARVHGRADGVAARRSRRASTIPTEIDPLPHAARARCASTTATSAGTTASTTRTSTTAICAACSPTRPSSPTT